MKLPINNEKEVNIESLEKKKMEEIEAKAEVQRQKLINKGKLDQENTRMMSEMMHNMNKSQLYGLNEQEKIELIQQQCKQVEENQEQCPLKNVKESFVKGKEKIMVALVVIIMLILAIGVTPSGAWFEAIQTSYVELLVDFFRVGLLGVGGYLIYKLIKK